MSMQCVILHMSKPKHLFNLLSSNKKDNNSPSLIKYIIYNFKQDRHMYVINTVVFNNNNISSNSPNQLGNLSCCHPIKIEFVIFSRSINFQTKNENIMNIQLICI